MTTNTRTLRSRLRHIEIAPEPGFEVVASFPVSRGSIVVERANRGLAIRFSSSFSDGPTSRVIIDRTVIRQVVEAMIDELEGRR